MKAGNTQAQSFTGLLYTSQNLQTNHPVKAGNLQAHPSTGLVNQKHTIPTNLPVLNPLACWGNPLCICFFGGGRAHPLQLKPKIRKNSQDYSWFKHASEDSLSKNKQFERNEKKQVTIQVPSKICFFFVLVCVCMCFLACWHMWNSNYQTQLSTKFLISFAVVIHLTYNTT